MPPARLPERRTTYSKDEARAQIAELVRNFQQNETLFVRDGDEAQLENDYIRPLFRFLNWNVNNEGLAPSQWEFVVQRTDLGGKRPDYLMRLDGRDLIVMEAKKSWYSMHDPKWLNQVYAYAYSTQSNPTPRKVDFAILTDFQEFVLLDCTLKADEPEALLKFRILDWRYPDYLTHFDELWDLLERTNVLNASQSRTGGLWARLLTPREVKANRVPPDRAFLRALDDEKTGWRIRLAKDMKRNNPDLDGQVITAASQLLIDRVVFTKALSDRDIEQDYLTELANTISRDDGTGGYQAVCQRVFAKLNQTYNGSVFAPRPELEAVAVTNRVLRSIIDEMLPENSPYNFAAMPVEILGTIYERFLGRVVRATDHQVKIEEKPEVRKAGGVYYTPQHIVRYIVEHTLGTALGQCRTPSDVSKLRILDPACGSGSFLLEVYDALIQWHKRYYGQKTRLSVKDRQAAYYDEGGQVRLTSKLKRDILLNNIFGIDIDPQAVEVTGFSLSLKALEETRREELYEEVNLFRSTVLPDFSKNIKCGNSLIGTDFYSLSIAPAVSAKGINALDWRTEFRKIMQDGGFSVVVGNPPWLMAGYYVKDSLEYLRSTYQAAQGKFDLYYVFLEKAFEVLAPDGLLGMIVPNKFFHTEAASNLRGLLGKWNSVRSIVDFGPGQVFADATNYSCILILRKSESTTNAMYTRAGTELDTIASYQIPRSSLQSGPWYLFDRESRALFRRLDSLGTPLGDLTAQFGAGLQTGADRILTFDSAQVRKVGLEQRLLRRLLRGRDVRRYSVAEQPKLLLFPYKVQDDAYVPLSEKELRAYSQAHQYLLENRAALAKRVWFGKNAEELSGKWYGMMYLQAYGFFEKPHILTPSLSSRANFALGTGDLFATGTAGVTSIIPRDDIREDLRYILGLLNSDLLSYYAVSHSPVFSGEFYKFSSPYLRNLPIRRIGAGDASDRRISDQIVQFVDRMINLEAQQRRVGVSQVERTSIERQIQATDDLINGLVSELYRLTTKESELVAHSRDSLWKRVEQD